MAEPARRDITGVILAGGRATRMGGADKGLLDLDGTPLVQHVIERLRPQVADLLISANRNLDRYAAFGARVVADENKDFAGPLAGMLAAMRAATTDWIACVPCDAPWLPLDLVARLSQAIGDARAAVARSADRVQPMFCLLRAQFAEDLAHALRAGERRAAVWLRAAGAIEVEFADAAAFANLNTADDLQRHRRRARTAGPRD